MRLLIDGYNLLHATDLFGAGKAAGTLQGSRESLLAFLAASLSAGDRRATTIVFDAAGAPPGLPRTVHRDHITVRYAREYADADALLEEIVEEHRAPRGLLVVSSDHRVQRAARHRGAKFIDSEVWYREQVRQTRAASNRSTADKSHVRGGDVAHWVQEFETPEVAKLAAEIRGRSTARPPTQGETTSSKENAAEIGDLKNPFPTGYGEDLLDEE